MMRCASARRAKTILKRGADSDLCIFDDEVMDYASMLPAGRCFYFAPARLHDRAKLKRSGRRQDNIRRERDGPAPFLQSLHERRQVGCLIWILRVAHMSTPIRRIRSRCCCARAASGHAAAAPPNTVMISRRFMDLPSIQFRRSTQVIKTGNCRKGNRWAVWQCAPHKS